ncbi:uncharacterized protein SAPINGB_P001711 [Magnusiomyces paraingens]|uniref:Alternative oxidase n=1 Tax=Magnusiomyces paraingens TaxID=2606893 RepID=A0A5E8B7A6_9ASCO|nr:uncharacterized protein SAPINGB_P001711 [Saprochaete ingens]VVT47438.1 unnamed protein product [Saprochaete ingens]
MTITKFSTTKLPSFLLASSSQLRYSMATSSPLHLRWISHQAVEKKSWDKTLADINTHNEAEEADSHRAMLTRDHPGATMAQLKSVEVAHHVPETWTDAAAQKTLHLVRYGFDLLTGYHHVPKGEENNPRYIMTREKWLERFVFLESVAGVPGMVGGMVRHLHSLRLLRRDRAWIETLLDEAYNERMHLITFLSVYQPGWAMRGLLLLAQGTFFNLFFVAYLIMPRVCHRFVGYLEEEAVVTYSRCIEDIEAGRLPEWKTEPAPKIAKKYWKMGEDATMLDLIYYVRADESKHREVNHTFGNLDQKLDRNPYALRVEDNEQRPQPASDFRYSKPAGWRRSEIAA